MGGFGTRRLAWLVAAAAAAAPAGPALAQGGWWDFKWPYRRSVSVATIPETALAGDEIAVVTMPTAGLIRPGGADIRVTTVGQAVVPHRVLMVGPGDQVRVAFALRAGVRRYFVYFGNPKPPGPPADLEIRRGVLLESYAYTGGPLATPAQVKRLFEKPGRLIGRDFQDRIFLGHNPFGPQNELCSLFAAHLVCPANGEYVFSTSSQDASLLLVDGQVVVANGGRHRPQRRAARQGRVYLKKGLHELKVYHVNTEGDPVVVAAWRPPDGDRLWAIPPRAFAPIVRAAPDMIERYGRAHQADFIPVHAGESFIANQYFQRYAFRALTKGSAAGPTFEWDFGDGQTGSGPRIDHVYLRNGLFKVTLAARLGAQTIERTNAIYVSRPWDKVTVNKLDPLADHARVVAGYDLSAADAREIGAAIVLFGRAGMRAEVLRAGDVLIKRDSAQARVLREVVPVYADALVEAGEASRAVAALLKGSEMSKDPAVGALLTTRAGQVALAAGDLDKALAVFDRSVRTYAALTTDRAVRDARIGVGDVWRRRGDYAKALAAYEQARPLQQSGFEKLAVRKGDLARQSEDYIRRGLFADAREAIDDLEYEFPAEKLEGFSALLRAKLELAWRHYPAAAEQAEGLVRVNPRSHYAPELLMLASRAHEAQGKADLSRQALSRLVKNYPESPLAAEAKKKLASE